MSQPPLGRLMVVNATPEPDLDLLRYAGMLARCSEWPRLVVAAPAAETLMRHLAPCSRLALGGRDDAELAFRVMLEPHLDVLFDFAAEAGCDLIVTRHPRGLEHARRLLGDLLYKAPCAVCLVPERVPRGVARPAVRVEATPKGRQLLSAAAALAHAAGSGEIFAVHPYFRYGLNPEWEPEESKGERDLQFYRFLARAGLAGVPCTPVLEEVSSQSRGLLRVAARLGADLLIIDPDAGQGPVWQWNRREAGALAYAAEIPVLAMRMAPARGAMAVLREQIFCGMEPIFN